jgi:ornithine carbamoyltransferase
VTQSLLTIASLSDDVFGRWLELSRRAPEPTFLKGHGVALIFERPSLRTRASSIAAINELGGYVAAFTGDEVGIDSRESAEDVARMLSQLFTYSAWRVKNHEVLERAVSATDGELGVVNLLTGCAHPTQAMADILTLADHFGAGDVESLAGRHVVYLGDATNVAKSLAIACLRVGCSVTIAAPTTYQVDGDFEQTARTFVRDGATLTLSSDARGALCDADAIYTDAFVSMGMEDERPQRLMDLHDFRLDAELLSVAPPSAIVLHCLPAHRGEEITGDVLDGPQSRIWRQAFHRKSAMIGALYLMGGAQ